MLSTAHVDWIAATFQGSSDTVQGIFESYGPFMEAGKGFFGYQTMVKGPNGAKIMSDGREKMGVHVVLNGDSLLNARVSNVSDKETLSKIVFYKGKVTRLDLAIDAHGTHLTVDDFAAAYERKEITSPAKSGTHIKNIGVDGRTFYLGSRSSERMLRIYDKNAEQKIVDTESWLRLELELKKVRANNAAYNIASATFQEQYYIAEEMYSFLAGSMPNLPRLWGGHKGKWTNWLDLFLISSFGLTTK